MCGVCACVCEESPVSVPQIPLSTASSSPSFSYDMNAVIVRQCSSVSHKANLDMCTEIGKRYISISPKIGFPISEREIVAASNSLPFIYTYIYILKVFPFSHILPRGCLSG